MTETIPSGQSRFDNRVNWARFYLTKEGLIDGSERGVWKLAEKGRDTKLSREQALEVFKRQHALLKSVDEAGVSDEMETKRAGPSAEEIDAPSQEIATGHREKVGQLLRNMSPKGFEQFAALLLRKAGFTEVNVTGRSNDGGIDGNGYLRINPMMTLRVLFQCKRYTSNAVSKDDIMKFQAAVMRERAEKGLCITTSVFTRGAREEALGGACEIELIDIERLIELMESLNIGLIEQKAYTIDANFFEEYLNA